MHFLKRKGIQAIGIDWSEELKKISKNYDPEVQFDTGDLRALPYENESIGNVLAFGSPEHVIEGPHQMFKEMYRVLRPGGVGIITVPYCSSVRSMIYRLSAEPIRQLKRNRFLRGALGKERLSEGNPTPYGQLLKEAYRPDIYIEVDFDGYFYEYQVTREQLEVELTLAGFRVEKCFAFAPESGLYHTFGRLVGRCERPNTVGKILLKIFSANQISHMLCGVVGK